MSGDHARNTMLFFSRLANPVRIVTWLAAVPCMILPVSHTTLPWFVLIFVGIRLFTSCTSFLIGYFWYWEFRYWQAKNRCADPVRFFLWQAEFGMRRIAASIVAFRLADLAWLWLLLAILFSCFLVPLFRQAFDARKQPEKYMYSESTSEKHTAYIRQIRRIVLFLLTTSVALWLYAWRDWLFV